MALVKLVKFNTQTNGRDKICRLLQYVSKFSWWYVERLKLGQELHDKFKTLENSFSATRKVMRLGKSVDLLFGAFKSLLVKDVVIRLALVGAKLNQAVYLIVDHYIWLVKLNIFKGDAKHHAKIAAKFWLVTIIFNLIRNVYDILTILTAEPNEIKENSKGHGNKIEAGIDALLADKPVVVDALKNFTDVFLPLAGLNYINISAGLQGVLGIISSLMAMLQTWDDKYKLTPA